MNVFAKKLARAAVGDKAKLTAKPPEVERQPAINLDDRAIGRALEGLPLEDLVGDKVRSLSIPDQNWQRISLIENSHWPEHADGAFANQVEGMVECVLAGKELPSFGELQNRDRWREDFAIYVQVCKIARRRIMQQCAPDLADIFANVAGAVREKLRVLEKQERAEAAAVGLSWLPSTDCRILQATLKWAEARSKPEAFMNTDARPASVVKPLGIELK